MAKRLRSAQPRLTQRQANAGPRGGRALALLPAVLAAVIYGCSIACGYLADDFLYLHRAQIGLTALLRQVTVASNPQMIRPLPALPWLLGAFAGGAAWLHGISVLLHALAGSLVAAIVWRGAAGATPPGTADPRSRWQGALCGALFVSFPLFTEPVIWLSASFDLWACALALAAAWVAGKDNGRLSAAAAGVLFGLALLAKESVVTLPLVVALLWPWRAVRRAVAIMAGIATCYLATRVALFGGPGGYLSGQGHSLVWSLAPREVLANVALRLPFRVLVPWKRASAVPFAEPFVLFSSLVLVAPILGWWLTAGSPARLRPGRRSAGARPAIARPLLAVLVALLPAVPFLHIEADQENSRLLYFPAAVLAVTLGLGRPPMSPRARRFALALVCCWGITTLWNERAWVQASWEVDHTLAAMTRLAPRLPAAATIFVAGHDTWHGAYTWRNGIADAAAWRGLRSDLHWFLGTVAGVDRPEEILGVNLFEIGIDASGNGVDWTECAKELLASPPAILAAWPLAERGRSTLAPGRDAVTPALVLPRRLSAVQVRLQLGRDRPSVPIPGRLFWLPVGHGRYNVSDSTPFFLGPRAGPEIVLRVPFSLAPPSAPLSEAAQVAFWLHLPPSGRSYVETMRVAAVARSCVAPGALFQASEGL